MEKNSAKTQKLRDKLNIWLLLAFRSFDRLYLAIFIVGLSCSHSGLAHAEQKPGSKQSTVTGKDEDPCDSGSDGTPVMVVIRPGRFTMGSLVNESGRNDDEGPQHAVTIPSPFALSRCEITVGQFRKFILDSGYQTTAEKDGNGCYAWDLEKQSWKQQAGKYWDNPGFSQNDDHPVTCVSWIDAQRYVDWLSQRSGAWYRLPTEAEWEYAARADTQGTRFDAEKNQCDYANGLGQEARDIAAKDWSFADCADGHVYTAPVASFYANEFGLYDMIGNVWEWTLDCWHENYQNAPFDGSVWLDQDKGNCDRRVLRGGSWFNYPQNLRSAFRLRVNADVALNNLGFRVARAL